MSHRLRLRTVQIEEWSSHRGCEPGGDMSTSKATPSSEPHHAQCLGNADASRGHQLASTGHAKTPRYAVEPRDEPGNRSQSHLSF